MSILNNNSCEPMPCPVGRYEDNSLYLDDARILLSALNVNQIRQKVAEELNLAFKIAQDHDATAEDFFRQAEKLRDVAKVYAQIDRIKNQKND